MARRLDGGVVGLVPCRTVQQGWAMSADAMARTPIKVTDRVFGGWLPTSTRAERARPGARDEELCNARRGAALLSQTPPVPVLQRAADPAWPVFGAVQGRGFRISSDPQDIVVAVRSHGSVSLVVVTADDPHVVTLPAVSRLDLGAQSLLVDKQLRGV